MLTQGPAKRNLNSATLEHRDRCERCHPDYSSRAERCWGRGPRGSRCDKITTADISDRREFHRPGQREARARNSIAPGFDALVFRPRGGSRHYELTYIRRLEVASQLLCRSRRSVMRRADHGYMLSERKHGAQAGRACSKQGLRPICNSAILEHRNRRQGVIRFQRRASACWNTAAEGGTEHPADISDRRKSGPRKALSAIGTRDSRL